MPSPTPSDRPRRARAGPHGSLTPGAALFPLRLFLGGTFVYAGMQKLSDPGYLTRGSATYIGTQLQQFAHGTPGGFLLRALAIPHPALTGVLTAVLELFVGLLVLAGLLTRWAAMAGMLFNLLLFLTNSWKTHPYFLGSDIVFVFAWLPIALAGTAGQPAVDSWLQTRRGRAPSRAGVARGSGRGGSARGRAAVATAGPAALSRRAVLGVGLGAAGAATAALAGISVFIRSRRAPAVVTRTAQLGGNAGAAGAGAGAAGPAATTTTGTSATAAPGSAPASGATAGALPKGAVRLGPVSRLPVGQAALYTDPVDQSPDIVLRRAPSTFAALSAVCTHAGCTVQYQPSASGPQLVCPCHGSVFDAVTGAVIQGPAIQPLPKREVFDHGGTLYAVPVR